MTGRWILAFAIALGALGFSTIGTAFAVEPAAETAAAEPAAEAAPKAADFSRGNRGMYGILAGARAEEKREAEETPAHQ